MILLKAEKRKELARQLSKVRGNHKVPGVLYGPATRSAYGPTVQGIHVSVDEKEFEKAYSEAGETSLVHLDLEGKQVPVLIHEIQKHPVQDNVLHVDFYSPDLSKKVDIMVPLVFTGEAPAVKELGGTFIKYMQEIEVSALPQNIPHEIQVSIEGLGTFEDRILVQNLVFPEGVSTKRHGEDAICQVVPAEDVEKELETPVQENVEEVKLVEKEKKSALAEGEETQKEGAKGK